ncbi:MAG: chromosomal replication initiator protein DnaA [Holosporaceae bacterium]|nr:chromosomal replication initiator protein DnaA [Holosporaceae bacterium]
MGDVVLESVWNSVCLKLRSELGDPVVDSWISPLLVDRLEGDTLYVKAPSAFLRDWVANNYGGRIADLCRRECENVKNVDITASIASAVRVKSPVGRSKTSSERARTEDSVDLSIPLDPKLTFENFVVGKPNELAYAAALRVAECDNVVYNPLFLYGPVGLGKTHLMHSIAWSIKSRSANRNIAYMSAEKFMYHFIKSVRFRDTMAFKEQFRAVDVLMIDDIQFICGKESTQEEFFHTFNALVDNNRQVIVSADKSPSDLDGMEERLRSRLGWGLVADIHPTTYELRLSILQSKVTTAPVPVPGKVLEFVAHKITSNIRELEGALNRIIANALFVGREITVESARDVLSDLLRTSDRKVTIDEIQKKVAAHYAIKMSDMFSPRRVRQVALPRQIAMYLAKKLTTMSLPEIGKNFGGRDHTTVLHAVKKVEDVIANDANLSEDVRLLINILTR